MFQRHILLIFLNITSSTRLSVKSNLILGETPNAVANLKIVKLIFFILVDKYFSILTFAFA